MQTLDSKQLKYISGGAEASEAYSIDAIAATSGGETIATRAGLYDSCSRWQNGAVGAALGDFLYSLGKSLGWWGK